MSLFTILGGRGEGGGGSPERNQVVMGVSRKGRRLQGQKLFYPKGNDYFKFCMETILSVDQTIYVQLEL